MNDFESQLNEIQNCVLNKALTEEERNNYTESLFESIKHRKYSSFACKMLFKSVT